MEFTQLLRASREGEAKALDMVLPLVYDELRRIAHRYLGSERSGHTLQTTALVNEAYVRLAGADLAFEDRVHFFAVAARTMRRILVDYANTRSSLKRGGGAAKVELDEAMAVQHEPDGQLLLVDWALTALEAQDERKARILELIFFGGLSREQVAETMQISPATVYRELKVAKAWIHAEINRGLNL